ncbi:MAG: phosphatidate cytidylyltransferase [Parachlamydiaceae bacterium]|nr:phosphatidate cytidylyltransferase [Parachlamydiaceae bacterium]
MSKQLKQRLLMGSLATIITLLSIYYSYIPWFTPIFVLLNASFISCALWEYYRLAKNKGVQPLMILGVFFTICYVISIYLGQQYPVLHFLPPLVLFTTLVVAFLAFFNQQAGPVNNLAITLFGIAYLTIPLSFGLKINYFPFQDNIEDGRLWLAYVLVIAKMTDTGAYIFGKSFGKTKLVPHISPKKTVEGAIGGLIAAMAASVFFYLYFDHPQALSPLKMTLWQSIWLSLFISLFAQFGDLAESILKRDAGVKDSSDLPGLGGMLDVVDSLVFTLPFMYFILKMKLLT